MDKAVKPIAFWLYVCAAMVVAMMLIGAATRLTESGLSMVEWRPLFGWLPPMTAAEWNRIFELYRQTSEYRIQHYGMELPAFKTIFWWEYIHRVWGRLIGLVFVLPLLWFVAKRRLPRHLTPHLILLLFLGSMQGFVGWWMVKSGFVDREDVSQYRLVAHLSVALLILAYLLWLAVGLNFNRKQQEELSRKWPVWVIFIIFLLTIISGGFVAGLNAGVIYSDWPFMGGTFMPSDYNTSNFWWTNALENPAAAQFHHRLLAYCSVAAALWFCWIIHRQEIDPKWLRLAKVVAAVAVLQLIIGIATLLSVVPTGLGVIHQLGAITLFCLAVLSLRLAYL